MEIIYIILVFVFVSIIVFGSPSYSVVSPDSSKGTHLEILKYHLRQLNINNKLVIIDNYLFPRNYDDNYIDFFIEIFNDSLKECNELEIITLENHNKDLRILMNNKIIEIYPYLKIKYKFTNFFHDRFWIADDAKGLYVGTSLNGIGKKFSMIDFLLDDDTEDIIFQLKRIK